MFSVINSNCEPRQLSALRLQTLRQWFVSEWGEIDPFDGVHKGRSVPSPLLAIADQKLIGGLVFKWHVLAGTHDVKLWINALWVEPEYRGHGAGLGLVQAAQTEAAGIGEKELYAYSNMPMLYQKSDWLIVDDSDASKVLKVRL